MSQDSQAQAAQAAKRNILIVDDTPMQITVLSQILAPAYNIKAATSGKKGLELAGKHVLDLILLDIVMEDMSGFDVLHALKSEEKTKNIPVIFISSVENPDPDAISLAAGYLLKPFEKDAVLQKIAAALG